MSQRYAIYYAPVAEAPLARLGAEVLGRDASSGSALAQSALAGFTAERLAKITAEPRRYGFHATLKPPFRLVDGVTPADLEREAKRQAERLAPVAVPLQLGILSGFVALLPRQPPPALRHLADVAVEAFDRFRTPPSAEELQRRRATGLTPAQERNLVRWGYPYVFDEFRFHMTLSQRLERSEAERFIAGLAERFVPVLEHPVVIDGLSLFVQETSEAPFRIRAQFRFGRAGA